LLTAGATYLHAVTTANYCGPQATIPGTTELSTNCPNQVNGYRSTAASGFTEDSVIAPPGPEAPSGTQLPVAPKFKGNIVARYSFALADWEAHVQAGYVYQSGSEPLLRLVDQQDLGALPSYGIVDLATGAMRNKLALEFAVTNVFDTRGQLTRFVECATTSCTQPYVIPTQPRTLWLKVGQKF
jgi:iron complex outermembrane recepter protein